ncbi:MAG: XRE family transcriptional regulator [Curvibacter sp.]|nr:MAG: XRE family transcriptional regulator [Curvibacter sp.]
MSDAFISNNDFASALRSIRKFKGLSQEDFSTTSSRTYVSTLERNLKSPTLNKVENIAEVLDVHPLTLLALSYVRNADASVVDSLLSLISKEVSELK